MRDSLLTSLTFTALISAPCAKAEERALPPRPESAVMPDITRAIRNLSRRSGKILSSAVLLGLALLSLGLPSRLLADRLDPMAIQVPDKVTPKAYAFDLNQVTLLDGPFKHAQKIQRQYLLETKLDSLLYPFRREAGLPNPAKGSDYLGWGTTGHALAHYLSACAMIYRNTGDVELKKSADELVAKLAECQAAMKNGYLGGMPEKSILHMEKLINEPAFQVGPAWYVQHKIYAGLLDMYLLTGNRQALDVLEKTIDWVIQNTNQLDEKQMQEMLGIEHGGMNEVLANLYSVTGKEKHLLLAQRFNQRKVIDPMAENQDVFDGLHANTQMPKFIGANRQYQLTGEEKLAKAARACWETVVAERSYVTGGNSIGEAFSPKGHLSEYVHLHTAETCNSHNMLKLTRGLFITEPQPRYADYYERTLWNQILSTVHPKTGGQLYFQELESGQSKKGWGEFAKGGSSCSCCAGTGLESVAKFADSIYFNDGAEGLFVNLFIASELNWKARGVQVRQETRYPDEGATRLVFSCPAPVGLTVHLRHPWWATQRFEIRINGEKQAITSVPGSYVPLQRQWKNGDTLEVLMPMTLHLEGFKDYPKRAAVMYGPLVMAGMTPKGNHFSALIGEKDSIFKEFKALEGKSLEFSAPAAICRTSLETVAAEPVVFKPLFRVVDETYAVYWDCMTSQEFAALPAVFQDEIARHKALEPQTVDLVLSFVNAKEFRENGRETMQGYLLGRGVMPRTFEQVSEEAHGVKVTIGAKGWLNKSGVDYDDMYPNVFRFPGDIAYRTRYLPGGGGYSYQMKVEPGASQKCQIRLWHPDLNEHGRSTKGVGAFEVLVDDQLIGTTKADDLPFNTFVDVSYPIPAALTAGKSTVTLSLRAKKHIRGIYEVRILKDGALPPVSPLQVQNAIPSQGLPTDRLDPLAVLVPDKVASKAYAFDLNQVTLLKSRFTQAQEIQRQILVETKLDTLLYPFRREAGLPNPVKGNDALCWATTGHAMGHYLSACAMIYRNTGDVELKKSADEAVVKLAECQAAMKNGYLGGMPEKSILLAERLVNDRAFQVGVPWYVQHKIYAGLLDMYVLAGNRQALDVLEKTIDWVIQNTNQLNEQQMQEMLNAEHGGMTEVLANLYSVTGKEKHLLLAQRFNHHKVIDPMAENQDLLDSLHANTQFPKFIGALRQYQLTGDEKLGKAARAFWETVVSERSYVTGGNSMREAFSPKARLSEYVHVETTESCNEHNMLKLTRGLFITEPQARHADYYERTLWNHILSALHPKTGGQLYFQKLESGSSKGPWDGFSGQCSCCRATSLESVAKFADSIYFNDGAEGLFVNLFIPSELNWKARGVQVRQETRYPDEGATRLVFSCPAPVGLTVHLRHPWWATQSFEIRINGEKQAITSVPGSYVPLQRQWKNGDTLEVLMPMTLHLEGFKDYPKRAAVMYGPLVMAGMTPQGNHFTALVGEKEAIFKEFKALEGKSLEFSAPAAICRTSLETVATEPVVFKPFFRVVDETYSIYWDCLSSQEFAALPAVFEEEIARHKALEPKTVDLVLSFVNTTEFREKGRETMQGYLLGRGVLPRTLEQVSEDTHGVKVTSGANAYMGQTGVAPDAKYPNLFRFPGDLAYRTRYLPGGGGYSYQMKVEPGASQKCQIRLWHPDISEHGRSVKGVGTFEVLVDDQLIGTTKADDLPFNTFVDVAYPIPAALTEGKSTVTLSLRTKNSIRGIYEVRILKD